MQRVEEQRQRLTVADGAVTNSIACAGAFAIAAAARLHAHTDRVTVLGGRGVRALSVFYRHWCDVRLDRADRCRVGRRLTGIGTGQCNPDAERQYQ
jgi:hypothetical protein